MNSLVWFRNVNNTLILRVLLKEADGEGRAMLTYATPNMTIAVIADNESAPTVYQTFEDISILGTYSAPSAGKARFCAIDDLTNPGLYEIQIPNARPSSKALHVTICGIRDVKQFDFDIPLGIEHAFAGTLLAPDAINAAAFAPDVSSIFRP